MSTISQSINGESMEVTRVAGKTEQGWFVGIGIGYHTTVYLTKAETVELFASLEALIKEETPLIEKRWPFNADQAGAGDDHIEGCGSPECDPDGNDPTIAYEDQEPEDDINF